SSSPAPDAIFIGQFLTLDPGHPRAEAIAVSAGRIVAVGSKAEVEALANKGTRKITISGVVVPGFADAHTHPEAIGVQLETPDPQGGLIRRDAAGQPSGMLIDNAQELVPL